MCLCSFKPCFVSTVYLADHRRCTLQAEAAYAQGKEKASGAADYAKETAQQAADATYDAAGQAKEQVRLSSNFSNRYHHLSSAAGC